MKSKGFNLNKSSAFGWLLISIWIILDLLFIITPIYLTMQHYTFNIIFWILLIINGLFTSYFWISGLKNIMVFLIYNLIKKPELKAEKQILNKPLPNDWNPKVLLLYATCNDFIPSALSQSMDQNYSNYETVILDDSQDKSYIRQINEFKNIHPEVNVIRRKNHVGFKAGNINHFLQNYHNYDYFVLLDSDEVIPNDFITKSLHYFASNPKMGILQCTHDSNRNQNKFMSEFSRSSTTFWRVENTFKLKYGFSCMYGHGAMISRKCYEATNGFPQIVAEDISFSLESNFCGFTIGFSNFILCHEEFPINYSAFKKRQIKWASGNWEFMMKYTFKILKSHQLKWYEKLDLFIFSYSLSLYALMSCSIIITSIIFPMMNVGILYTSLWAVIQVIWFYFAQTINDMIVQIKIGYPIYKIPLYIFNSMVLYGSMYWVTVKATLLMIFGKHKAKFIVTPKVNNKFNLKDAINYNYDEIIFGAIIIMIIIVFSGINPVSLLMMLGYIPGMLSPYLMSMSNHQSDYNKQVVKKMKYNYYQSMKITE